MKEVRFIEPLRKPEDDIVPSGSATEEVDEPLDLNIDDEDQLTLF